MMLPDVCVRPVTEADQVPLRVFVDAICAEPGVRSFFETRNGHSVLATACAVVADQKGCVVGVSAWAQEETIAVVTGLMVHADRRRFGVATALLQAMVDHLRQEGVLVIDATVGAHLPGVCALFEKAGFRVVGRSIYRRDAHGPARVLPFDDRAQPKDHDMVWVHFERRLLGRRMRKS